MHNVIQRVRCSGVFIHLLLVVYHKITISLSTVGKALNPSPTWRKSTTTHRFLPSPLLFCDAILDSCRCHPWLVLPLSRHRRRKAITLGLSSQSFAGGWVACSSHWPSLLKVALCKTATRFPVSLFNDGDERPPPLATPALCCPMFASLCCATGCYQTTVTGAYFGCSRVVVMIGNLNGCVEWAVMIAHMMRLLAADYYDLGTWYSISLDLTHL